MSLENKQDREAFQWPITQSVAIKAPARKVWDTIASRESLLESHPYLAANPIERWGDANSRDEVHYLNGVVYERHFRAWVEGVGFDLEIHRRKKPLAWVSWRITAIDADNARLSITVYPFALQRWPAIIRWVPLWLILRRYLGAYLRSVVRGFEWFITKGERVPRNQFGRHPWFSKS